MLGALTHWLQVGSPMPMHVVQGWRALTHWLRVGSPMPRHVLKRHSQLRELKSRMPDGKRKEPTVMAKVSKEEKNK